MKRDRTRDYATSAFRYWARRGCPTYEEAVERIRKRAIDRASGADPAEVVTFVDAELGRASAELCDILACAWVFDTLRERGREIVCEAVRAVYMAEPWREPKVNDIKMRVIAFTQKAYVSERTVYYYLRLARDLFASVRGLRTGESDW